MPQRSPSWLPGTRSEGGNRGLPEQGTFGLAARIAFASHQRQIDRAAVHALLSHEHHDAEAEDTGMMLAEPRFLRDRMLGALLAFEDAIITSRQEGTV
jgi:hypothetical protein